MQKIRKARSYWLSQFPKGLYRCFKDHNGVRELRTAAQGLERCSRDNNGAEECRTVPKGLRRCFRCSAGVTESKTATRESPDVFAAYDTVTELGMLPKTLRHRYLS